MSATDKPPLLVFPFEIDVHNRMFEAEPLTIMRVFLQCFDSKGRQALQVPQHVLEALAKRFLLVMSSQTNSLDAAFGGQVARQRNRLRELDRDWDVLWDFIQELERVRAEPRSKRGKGSPYDIAVERVAEKLGMSADNVRRIYKKAGKR